MIFIRVSTLLHACYTSQRCFDVCLGCKYFFSFCFVLRWSTVVFLRALGEQTTAKSKGRCCRPSKGRIIIQNDTMVVHEFINNLLGVSFDITGALSIDYKYSTIQRS